MQQPLIIKKIAVLGAGVMGAQIAAHCVNAGFETLLFDMHAKEGKDGNALAHKAIAHLAKLRPSPLATPETLKHLAAKNYEDNLEELSQCELIIEAISENMAWKEALYQKISPYLVENSVLVTNTSGLSINKLAQVLPQAHRHRFCGVHFFNPPRYMHLVELIPAKETNAHLIDALETWLTRYLGKGVVRAKDTPNFIANRIGVFSLLSALHHAERMGLELDEVDAITGTLLGRPKSATFRTMDVVGLDTMQHVVKTMQTELKEDPWYALFHLPDWLLKLIQEGHLGQKTGQGIYRKTREGIEVFRPRLGQYEPMRATVSPALSLILKNQDPKARIEALAASEDKQAQFLLACYRDLFHYAAFHLATIADNVRQVDSAMRYGFGWKQGPFETWQAIGLKRMCRMIEETPLSPSSEAELPAWLAELNAFYTQEGAYSPQENAYVPLSALPVYKRQFFRNHFNHEDNSALKTLYENEAIHMFHLQDDIAGLSFKTKANAINQAVIDGIEESLRCAMQQCQGLVIYQNDANIFSAGADLRAVSALIKENKFAALDAMLAAFQAVVMRLKYASIPVVAAVRGRALGGGCELMMHCASVVAAFESYPGLVEAGVGLIPAGGGTKEMAERAAFKAGQADLTPFIDAAFKQIATAQVSQSAPDAVQKGYLNASSCYVMHAEEVLYVAIEKVKSLQAANYLPPLASRFKAAGLEGRARLQAGLVNWLEGGFISSHDYFLATQVAHVLCGGEVNKDQEVDEQWMLKLEREAFMTLAATPLTQARILHVLETGKPLRN